MTDIYTDMFISDYWIREHYEESKVADTTRFYEPIFNKYGYTTLDFINSADHYMRDPRRFARIIQNSVSKLDEEARRLDKLSSDISMQESEIEAYKSSVKIPAIFYDSLFFAKAGWGGLEMKLEECGAYMPVLEDSGTQNCDTLDAVRPLRGPKHLKNMNDSDEQKLSELEDELTIE